MLRQELAKRRRCSLVKKYFHLRRRKGAARSVFEYRANLFQCYAGKPLDELGDRRAVLEVLEQRSDGHPRAAKNPSAAIAFSVAFHCITCRPINHASKHSTVRGSGTTWGKVTHRCTSAETPTLARITGHLCSEMPAEWRSARVLKHNVVISNDARNLLLSTPR